MKKEIFYCDICKEICDESKIFNKIGRLYFSGAYAMSAFTEINIEHICVNCSIKIHDIIENFIKR